jgi:PAS domain S-box-containing protein
MLLPNMTRPAPHAPSASGAAKAPRLRVLVADDIVGSRETLMQGVTALGHEALAAGSGAETLAMVERLHPDLVLLDLLMPDIDGFEVTRRLREQVADRWLPVIVTSSLHGESHFIHALSRGADDFLSRPVNPALLEAKLRHYARVLGLQARLASPALRQRAIHESIAEAVVTVDGRGRVTELNRAATTLFGAEAVGRSLYDLTGQDPDELESQTEIELRPADGRVVPLAVTAGHWTLGDERFTTFALHDLSERYRMERMKDEFLATVSHELRTPLTSILGSLGLLMAGAAGPLPPGAQELASVARRNGDRLSGLIDDVLDLTKLEGNRMVLQSRVCALDALVAEAVEANTGYAQRGGVLLAWDCVARAPQARVDPDRFLQIMANLLSNAIKHSVAGQTVRTRLSGGPGGWRIEVIDQGPGIAPAFRERLFDKFAQADSSDRRAIGGTGLGLYITRLLVQRMGGRILVESEPGQGATFSVLLPPHDPDRWRLIVARDHQRLQRLTQWVGALGPVQTATEIDAARALVAREGPPAAVVADPQGQGPADAFCQALKGLAPARAIVLCGDTIDDDFARTQGLDWIGAGEGARQRLVAHLHGADTPASNGSPHG